MLYIAFHSTFVERASIRI